MYVQWNLDLRKRNLRKNLDLEKFVGTTDFLVHKELFDNFRAISENKNKFSKKITIFS